MDIELREKLIGLAKEKITREDQSHDIHHALRVLSNVERIAQTEGGDMEILVPSALFHDIIIYQKNDPCSDNAATESAELAGEILEAIPEYPKEKIKEVYKCIESCSFTRKTDSNTLSLEAKILQDGDKLEATGVISIMRTFSSTGQMKRTFYHPEDPFCIKGRTPDDLKYAIDLFYTRLLVAKDRMHTDKAKEIAERRTEILRDFLRELELELDGK